MSQSIQEMVARPRQYHFSDGFVEIGVGLLFAVGALMLYALSILLSQPILAGALALAIVIVASAAAVLVKRGIEAAKERVTYPRTGYARTNTEISRGGKWAVIVFALVLSFAIAVLPEQLNKGSFALGALMSMVLVVFGMRAHLMRFYLLAVLAAGLAFLVPYLVESESGSGIAVLAGIGLLLMASGALALARYLRTTRSPQEHPHG